MPKKKPIKKAPQGKKRDAANTGYREFMSGFAGYARDNGIKIHGGRGSFARRAGEVWKELKGKPAWRENLDVVLPQFLKPEKADKPVDFRQKELDILENVGGREHQWWDIKSTYGSWSEISSVNPAVDRLIVEGGAEGQGPGNDITNDLDAALLYRGFKDAVKEEMMEPYSYLEFDRIEENGQGGADTIYKLVESDIYEVRKHDKVSYKWSDKVVGEFPGMNKEPAGRSVKIESRTGKKEKDVAMPVRETRLNELLKLKTSLMEDIRFAKEMGEGYSGDMAKLKKVKSEIDSYL